MKKTAFLMMTIVLLASCKKEDSTPKPRLSNKSGLVINNFSFVGTWNCYDWIVDKMTGVKKQRSIVFVEGSSPSDLRMYMNQHKSDSTIENQLFGNIIINHDSNYFDSGIIFSGSARYKGYISSDTTIMLYHYEDHPINGIDTFQLDTFFRTKY